MVAHQTTSDAPAPSRYFTVVGWICILSGLHIIVTSVINYSQAFRVLKVARPELLLTFASRCGLSVLSVASGFAMWKRRSWAPWLMSLTGGATVASCVWFFARAVPPYIDLIQESRHSVPMVALDLAFSILSKVLQLLIWLAVLGGLYRENGRRQFPPSRPEFTKATLFGLSLLGLLLMLLIYYQVVRIGPS